MTPWYPLLVLGVGLATVVAGIVALRLHAFLALILAAMVVSLLAPGPWEQKIPRVADAFGETAAGVAIVIALAAIIGRAMTASGAADRIVQLFLELFGERRAATALMASGFTLAIPVFFDTVFFLLVPLVRSMVRRTGGHYLKYLMAIACCAATHALVPPTPGPLIIAETLQVELGTMILVGMVVALPAAMAGLLFAAWADRHLPIELPKNADDALSPQRNSPKMSPLPNLGWSLAPILLPVALIGLSTILRACGNSDAPNALRSQLALFFSVLGNPNLALMLSAAIALWTYWIHTSPTAAELAAEVSDALLAAGVIVLITCAGGAFGSMLKAAELAPAIRDVAGSHTLNGLGLLALVFTVAALIKFAQGSSTASMIVTSAMVSAMLEPGSTAFHPVYVATAIGSGSLVGSWMNDSGFWIFSRMGGLSELQTLRTWTPLLALMGFTGLATSMAMAVILPLR